MASPKDRRKDMKFYTENTSIFGTPLLPSAAELEWLESNKEMKTQGRAKLAEDIAKWSKPSKHKRDNHEALLKEEDKVVRKAVSL
jgi:hypothetical protein